MRLQGKVDDKKQNHFDIFKLLNSVSAGGATKGGATSKMSCPPCKIGHKRYIFRVFLKAYPINQVMEENVFDFLYVTVSKLYEGRFPAVKGIKIVVVAIAALRGLVKVVLLWTYLITAASSSLLCRFL